MPPPGHSRDMGQSSVVVDVQRAPEQKARATLRLHVQARPITPYPSSIVTAPELGVKEADEAVTRDHESVRLPPFEVPRRTGPRWLRSPGRSGPGDPPDVSRGMAPPEAAAQPLRLCPTPEAGKRPEAQTEPPGAGAVRPPAGGAGEPRRGGRSRPAAWPGWPACRAASGRLRCRESWCWHPAPSPRR